MLEGCWQSQVLARCGRENFGSERAGRIPVKGVAEYDISDLEVDKYRQAPALE